MVEALKESHKKVFQSIIQDQLVIYTENNQYSKHILNEFSLILCLSANDENTRQDSVSIIEKVDNEDSYFRLALYCCMLIFIVERHYLDGVSREFLKLIGKVLKIPPTDIILVECTLTSWLVEQEEKLVNSKANDSANKSKLGRYLKIGAVSVGAGVALAVTGGMVKKKNNYEQELLLA